MHEENNTVGWFHPTSGDSHSVPRGFHSRLIGIYRTIRHFYNIPGHWPPFSNALRVCTALKRHLNFVSFIVAPFFLLFRGRCSNAGVWVWARDICIYIFFVAKRNIFHGDGVSIWTIRHYGFGKNTFNFITKNYL